MRRMRALIAMACALVLGCSTTIDADDYDRTCRDASECAAILVGDMCDCDCRYGAINETSLADYARDRAEIDCSVSCGPCPEAPPTVCRQGSCAVE